jgi:hypothetical protein
MMGDRSFQLSHGQTSAETKRAQVDLGEGVVRRNIGKGHDTISIDASVDLPLRGREKGIRQEALDWEQAANGQKDADDSHATKHGEKIAAVV